MAQIEKIEAVIQTKCSPILFYGFFNSNTSKLVVIVPQQFQSAEPIEGEEGCAGDVKLYKYNLGGPKTVKVNGVERSITYEVLERDVMEKEMLWSCKNFKAQRTVKWCFEFEKANDACPKPDNYVVSLQLRSPMC